MDVANARNILFGKTELKSLTFRGPCIVIYSYNECQRDALIFQIYFRNRTLHVSDSYSVHHQESSTVHTAIGVCHNEISKMGKCINLYTGTM